MRERLHPELQDKRGPIGCIEMLARLDPASAARIHANDTPKLIRAIEVCFAARKPMSECWHEIRSPAFVCCASASIRRALHSMTGSTDAVPRCSPQGLIAKTRTLLARYGRSRRSIRSAIVRRSRFCSRSMSEKAAIAEAQQGHRNYAKRQMTWFRREPEVHWLEGFGDSKNIHGEAARLLTAATQPRPETGPASPMQELRRDESSLQLQAGSQT